jgi:integrase
VSRKRANGEGSIFPYRSGFAAYVWVTTPAGRRQRKYVYGRDRDTLHAKWLELHRRSNAGVVATRVPTLAGYLRYWLAEVIRPNRAPLTYATYETLSRLYITPGLGARRLDLLTVRDVQTWLHRVKERCTCCAQGKDARRPVDRQRCCAVGACCQTHPSPRLIRDLRTVLRSALSNAVTEELISKNVATPVKVPSGRTRKRQAWSTDEARQFLESARAADDPLYAAWAMILVLGLRKGEVLGLAWEQVDLDERQLWIEWQVQRVGRQLIRRQTKTEASDAALPMPDLIVAALKHRVEVQAADRMRAADVWLGAAPDTSFVFTGRYGAVIDPRTLNRVFTARCTAAGVRRITVHDARRTCATLLVDLDVHPRVVMQILRHAQISVTMEIYAKASSTATREALRRLGESLDRPDIEAAE